MLGSLDASSQDGFVFDMLSSRQPKANQLAARSSSDRSDHGEHKFCSVARPGDRDKLDSGQSELENVSCPPPTLVLADIPVNVDALIINDLATLPFAFLPDEYLSKLFFKSILSGNCVLLRAVMYRVVRKYGPTRAVSWFRRPIPKSNQVSAESKPPTACTSASSVPHQHRSGVQDSGSSFSGELIHYVVEKGYRDIAELMLAGDPDLASVVCEQSGLTPLMVATRSAQEPLFTLLLDHKVDPWVFDVHRRTAICWAILNGHWRVANTVLRRAVAGKEYLLHWYCSWKLNQLWVLPVEKDGEEIVLDSVVLKEVLRVLTFLGRSINAKPILLNLGIFHSLAVLSDLKFCDCSLVDLLYCVVSLLYGHQPQLPIVQQQQSFEPNLAISSEALQVFMQERWPERCLRILDAHLKEPDRNWVAMTAMHPLIAVFTVLDAGDYFRNACAFDLSNCVKRLELSKIGSMIFIGNYISCAACHSPAYMKQLCIAFVSALAIYYHFLRVCYFPDSTFRCKTLALWDHFYRKCMPMFETKISCEVIQKHQLNQIRAEALAMAFSLKFPMSCDGCVGKRKVDVSNTALLRTGSFSRISDYFCHSESCKDITNNDQWAIVTDKLLNPTMSWQLTNMAAMFGRQESLPSHNEFHHLPISCIDRPHPSFIGCSSSLSTNSHSFINRMYNNRRAISPGPFNQMPANLKSKQSFLSHSSSTPNIRALLPYSCSRSSIDHERFCPILDRAESAHLPSSRNHEQSGYLSSDVLMKPVLIPLGSRWFSVSPLWWVENAIWEPTHSEWPVLVKRNRYFQRKNQLCSNENKSHILSTDEGKELFFDNTSQENISELSFSHRSILSHLLGKHTTYADIAATGRRTGRNYGNNSIKSYREENDTLNNEDCPILDATKTHYPPSPESIQITAWIQAWCGLHRSIGFGRNPLNISERLCLNLLPPGSSFQTIDEGFLNNKYPFNFMKETFENLICSEVKTWRTWLEKFLTLDDLEYCSNSIYLENGLNPIIHNSHNPYGSKLNQLCEMSDASCLLIGEYRFPNEEFEQEFLVGKRYGTRMIIGVDNYEIGYRKGLAAKVFDRDCTADYCIRRLAEMAKSWTGTSASHYVRCSNAAAPLMDSSKVVQPYCVTFETSDRWYLIRPLMDWNLDEHLAKGDWGACESCDSIGCHAHSGALVNLISQMMQGLQFLHARNPPMFHGNLKPSNVLVDSQGNLKLVDFGFGKLFIPTHNGTGPCRLADNKIDPRCWKPAEFYQPVIPYSCASDVQSAGMLAYFILTLGRHHPYISQAEPLTATPTTLGELQQRVLSADYDLYRVSGEAQDIIDVMLAYNPEDRPCSQDILEHILFWSTQQRMDFMLRAAMVPQLETVIWATTRSPGTPRQDSGVGSMGASFGASTYWSCNVGIGKHDSAVYHENDFAGVRDRKLDVGAKFLGDFMTPVSVDRNLRNLLGATPVDACSMDRVQGCHNSHKTHNAIPPLSCVSLMRLFALADSQDCCTELLRMESENDLLTHLFRLTCEWYPELTLDLYKECRRLGMLNIIKNL